MNLSHVIKGPIVTEKSMKLSEQNQYVLLVHQDATKDDVKTAVNKFFGIEVKAVKMIHLPQKIRVRSAIGPQPKRKPKKKAVICVAEGTTFDILKLATAPKAPAKKPSKKESSVS